MLPMASFSWLEVSSAPISDCTLSLDEMAAIEIENTVSELFQQERGVRQGSVLSPTLPHGDAQRNE